MASANLSSFLTQINADIIPATNSFTTSTSTSSPSLPISAKVTLLQAQIDQLSKNISTTLTSNAEEFKRLAAEVGGKEGQLHEIETDVHALNQDQDQDEMENQQQEVSS
jgi:protein transport protein DSL1/ZW10